MESVWCLRACHGGQARVEIAVKNRRAGLTLWLANERRLEAFLDETLFEMLDGARCHTQSGGYIRYFPRITKLARVAQEQGAGVNELCRRRFADAGLFVELLALGFR